MKFKVLITGDRNYTRQSTVDMILDGLFARYGEDLYIIHGGAKGADSLAKRWVDAKWMTRRFDHTWICDAEWEKYGRAAGPIRNHLMLDEGEPDIVVAFHDDIESSKGTKEMCEYAKKNDIPVILISKY